VEIFPNDPDVLVLDARAFVRIVGRSEVFAKVEGLLRVGRSLLNILRRFVSIRRTDAGAFDALAFVIDDGALRQLTGEFMEGTLRLFDVYAARSGRA